jgi:hypothetical protein
MFDSAHANGRSSTALRIATAALTTALVVATTTMASAQDGNAGITNKTALVGSWLETVTFPPESGRPTLKSLVSFHGDKTMVASDQGGVTTEPPFAESSGHGAWTHLNKRTFAYSVLYLFSDLSGNLQNYLKVRGVYTVSQSGNEYNGTSFAEVLDTDGNVLFSTEVTNAGTRIQPEIP